jgi:hypothetical protein
MSILKKINDYTINIKKENNQICKILKKKNYNISFDNSKKILYLNYKGKKIFGGNYIFFGIYQPENKLWIWASSIPGVNRNDILQIYELKKNKSYLFENDNNVDINFIFQLLNNDNILIDDMNKFKLIKKVLNFLSNSLFIITPLNKNGNIQFIGISNIIEKYF